MPTFEQAVLEEAIQGLLGGFVQRAAHGHEEDGKKGIPEGKAIPKSLRPQDALELVNCCCFSSEVAGEGSQNIQIPGGTVWAVAGVRGHAESLTSKDCKMIDVASYRPGTFMSCTLIRQKREAFAAVTSRMNGAFC